MKRFLKYTGISLGALLGLFIIFLLTQVRADMPVEELKAKYADKQSQFMELDGMQVHYKDEGRGIPLLLLHGTASSLHTWDQWTELLKDSFRIIRLDLPGFGLTGPNANNDYSMEFYNDFLNQFLDELGVDTFYMAGNSFGGRITWNYGLRNPERAVKLILLDASGYWEDGRTMTFGLQVAMTPVVKHLLEYVTPRATVKRSIRACFGNPDLVTDELVDRHYYLMLREGNRTAYVAKMNEPYENNSPKVKAVYQPTLIMWGSLDQIVPAVDAPKFDRDLPNSTLIMYEGIGHLPMEEIPERSAQDAMQFLLAAE